MTFTFESIVQHLQLIGAYLGFSIGVLRLVRYKKNRVNLIYGITFLAIGLFLALGFEASGSLPEPGMEMGSEYNLSLLYFGLVIFSCAIVRYLMRRSIGLNEVKSKEIGLCLTGTFGALFFLSLFFRNETAMNVAGNAICALITSYTLVEITSSIRTRKLPRVYFNLALISFFMCLSVLLDLIGILRGDIRFRQVSNFIPGLLLVYFHLLEIYYPMITDKKTIRSLSLTYKINRHQENVSAQLTQPKTPRKKLDVSENKNLLKESDLNRIEERLKFFLEEKRYLDEELRLPDLAAYLGVSVHQASLYLNQYKNMSFTDFINQNRIEEAKRLILEETNRNLIDIGLECGFNSYSPFHRACIRFTGFSPKELRNMVLQK
ncbi:AraC family transcriptional regulator [Leptospira gomenensis]|uniref:AraC family transcriptional regulator n=1 Tax=Leptospira gomenensis TaxID=2484974 RepID=A0A5F1YEE7_9LEPT|nr:helix-turn-helix domain-containing protein [Leptospira gomenensis]TGK37475.1 AraC family transcriptional regulator [Leptospira gomenensis]TGK39519.1 AraC family transcriptional regulator [Leptospira gomenensis]TGK43060.1 AraC family transcriptional regulator [Leptospira gomenensis]TGK54324.1 AraC family transcriptional regulator [Leptospira gomenensis]